MIDEIQLLLDKIQDGEDLIERAEAFFAEKNRNWPLGLAAQFEIYLERRRDQIFYEKHLLERMGWKHALGHDSRMDI